MALAQTQKARLERLIAAFQRDGFQVADPDPGPGKEVVIYHDKIGIRATHQTATIGTTGIKKKAFYVEGNHYEMGYLMGQLAEPEIASMCKDFTKLVALASVGPDTKKCRPLAWLAGMVLEIIIYWFSYNAYLEIPEHYRRELEGIYQGCQASAWAAGRDTEVAWLDLWVLNFGLDALLSFVYTGGQSPSPHSPGKSPWWVPRPPSPPQKRESLVDVSVSSPKARNLFQMSLWEIASRNLRSLSIPIMGDGFSVFGDNFHYFGLDFMVDATGIFGGAACMSIHRPEPIQTSRGVEGGLPFVSMTAPGIIGTITGVNSRGVGVGVSMAPAGDCNPASVGFNSLLLARQSIENGRSCDEAIEIMAKSSRGVPWIYILADGTDQKACVVEAAYTTSSFVDPLLYPPDWLKAYLPDRSFLETHPHSPAENRNGLMIRWSDYEYPRAYLDFNRGLFEASGKPYDPDAFTGREHINQSWKDSKCPSLNYFQPQRENNPNLIVATNAFVIPEARLCAMYELTAQLAQAYADDIQWRYDELTRRLTSTLDKNNGHMSYDEAKEIADFLAPDGDFPDYYNSKRKPLSEIPIRGSVSLMDLKKKTMESHYGYYADEWVKISLPNYLID
jgi:hypothetical protein